MPAPPQPQTEARSAAFAEAVWRLLEHDWRGTGTVAALACGFRPNGYPEFPTLTVTDIGRLDRLQPAVHLPIGPAGIELRLPHAIADIWVDFDELGAEVIDAIDGACAGRR